MITAPSRFPDVEALEPDRAAVRELAAHIYSAQSELALKVAKLDDDGAWAGDGYLSIVHWLSIHLGLGRVSARELVRVGHALAELTKVAEAFASGSLSYDKVRFIGQVAGTRRHLPLPRLRGAGTADPSPPPLPLGAGRPHRPG
jgi:Domain of unknown function (DUF222)